MLLTCSPPVFNNTGFLIIVDPLLHFSLCPSDSLSVCTLPTSSTNHMNLPRPPCPTPPSSLQPRAPSPTSPVEFPMNVKQAYKAFAAVPRSLAVLEPPQVGCDAWTVSGSQPETHAVMIGWSHPAPSSLELAAPCRRGLVMCCDVWNALIFLFFSFFFTCPQVPSWPFGVDSFFHPW